MGGGAEGRPLRVPEDAGTRTSRQTLPGRGGREEEGEGRGWREEDDAVHPG